MKQRHPIVLVRAGLVVAGLIGVVTVVPTVLDATSFPNDFAVDHASARELIARGDPYAPQRELLAEHAPEVAGDYPVHLFPGNPHTPVHVLFAAPLGLLPYGTARVAWFLLSVAAFAGAGVLIARAVGIGRATAVALGVGVLAIPLVGTDLRYGQSNGFVLACIAAAWWGQRSGRARLTGVTLGVATAARLFPGLLLLPLLRRKDYTAARWLVGSAVGLNLVAVGVIGIDGVSSFLAVSAENLWIWGAMPWNVSLSGALTRLWRPPGSVLGTLPGGALLVIAAGVLLLAWIAWRSPAERSGDPFIAALPIMAAASPLAWEHYLIVLLPAVVIAAQRERRDALMLGLAGVLLLRGGMVGSWLEGLGVPMTEHAMQAIRFSITLSVIIGVIALEWRPRALPRTELAVMREPEAAPARA